VRELKNVMQRASLLSKSAALRVGDLALPASTAPRVEGDLALDKDAIEQALARASGVVAQAAADLGMSRQALYRRMERFGIGRGTHDSQ
jgi:transcriptional regulator of acetoin/glycerol metabolism